jgi:cell division GTPase FtsZ
MVKPQITEVLYLASGKKQVDAPCCHLRQMTHTDLAPRMTIIGVGGAGIGAVDTMIGPTFSALNS